MDYVVEKNVPLPNARCSRGVCKYPFATMQVGDSFIGEANAQAAAYAHARRFGVKFSVRLIKGSESARIWRIA